MAKIFRLQENVPDVYTRKSRDFQLLCNLFDIMNGGVKQDIDSIPNILDTNTCSERLLPLLQTKLGFFTNKSLTSTEVRTVLGAFSRIVKDKGSNIGIREAIEVYLKLVGASGGSKITILNTQSQDTDVDTLKRIDNVYLIEILIEGKLYDLTVLTEMLKYVLPAGYKLTYGFYTAANFSTEVIKSDSINIIFLKKEANDSIKDASDTTVEGQVSTSGILDHDTDRLSLEDITLPNVNPLEVED